MSQTHNPCPLMSTSNSLSLALSSNKSWLSTVISMHWVSRDEQIQDEGPAFHDFQLRSKTDVYTIKYNTRKRIRWHESIEKAMDSDRTKVVLVTRPMKWPLGWSLKKRKDKEEGQMGSRSKGRRPRESGASHGGMASDPAHWSWGPRRERAWKDGWGWVPKTVCLA